jgi:protein-S-isoprenylcysteine O-methyltransferase Ste14
MPEINGIKEKNGEHPCGDAVQVLLLGFFLMVWVGDSFFLHVSTGPADYLPRFIRLIFLVFSLAIAIYLIRAGHVVVKHEQHPTGLVTNGGFKLVRHPLYLGSILVYLGLAVATASLFSLALWVIICVFYNYIAGYEEKLLEAKYGESYRMYAEKTGKWMPRKG